MTAAVLKAYIDVVDDGYGNLFGVIFCGVLCMYVRMLDDEKCTENAFYNGCEGYITLRIIWFTC